MLDTLEAVMFFTAAGVPLWLLLLCASCVGLGVLIMDRLRWISKLRRHEVVVTEHDKELQRLREKDILQNGRLIHIEDGMKRVEGNVKLLVSHLITGKGVSLPRIEI